MAGAMNGKAVVFDEDNPPTLADYEAASPRAKGWMSYMYADWPQSEIPKRCPFKVGTKEYKQYCDGQNAAMLAAQDSEE